jgi:hypothetical protein
MKRLGLASLQAKKSLAEESLWLEGQEPNDLTLITSNM